MLITTCIGPMTMITASRQSWGDFVLEGGIVSRHVQFSFNFPTLFITCTFTVGHMTDALLLLHMTHYESLLRSMTHNSYDS